ncbi:hypothetical protein D9756_003329 [Leucocoprinus leucothites]|uniref:trimethyllysine dioxygenase n=1 Tax=Leucocoprinus leucothites TaxID=201217 RepID=A0A8H5LJ68_9AGAR|nr:hypothetical protein D9756_003329 [Leucoagaricus leucothites]
MNCFRSILSFSSAKFPSRTCTTLHRSAARLRLPISATSSRGVYTSQISQGFGSVAAVKKDSSGSGLARLDDDMQRKDLPIVTANERKVTIGWDTKTWSRFHNIWLRDHCRCPKCFHPITKQRLLNTFEIPSDIQPLGIQRKADGLELTWQSSEPHVSFYPWSWLQSNSYDPAINHAQTIIEKVEWGTKIAQSPPTVTYSEAMDQDDRGLFKWLTDIDQFGFSFISGVPPTPEATEKLVERIGFIRETQSPSFLRKQNCECPLTPFTADRPRWTSTISPPFPHRWQWGATLLADGFYVASILKELHPEYYDILSRVSVPAHAAGEASSIYYPSPRSGYPVLGHDPCTRELVQVRWNNDDRSVMNHLEPDLVEKWYEAISAWNKCLKSPDSEYWVQLQPGTAVVVDNHRVLHGRSAFDGKRRMCGAYVGIDEYRSKLAVLRERFAPDTVQRATDHLPQANINGRNIWNSAL